MEFLLHKVKETIRKYNMIENEYEQIIERLVYKNKYD